MSGRQHAVAKEADIVGSDWYASGISGISDSFRSFFFPFFFSVICLFLYYLFFTLLGVPNASFHTIIHSSCVTSASAHLATGSSCYWSLNSKPRIMHNCTGVTGVGLPPLQEN